MSEQMKKKECRMCSVVFCITFAAALALIIGGFFVPPMGIIDGSVLTAVGELVLFPALAFGMRAVELGDLGTFYVTITSKGAESLQAFTAENITDAYAKFEPGGYLVDLRDHIVWNRTVNRRMQRLAKKLFDAGKLTPKHWEDFLSGDADFTIDADGNMVPNE